MRVNVVCNDKAEFTELIEQLKEEGISYLTTIVENINHRTHPPTCRYEYEVDFWYDGRLI